MPSQKDYSFEAFLQQISIPIGLFLFVLTGGSLGYFLLWQPVNGTWLDAIYMTFITITTVGYNEIHPLNSAGRILTILVSVTGIASLFYLFTAVMDYLVFRRLRDDPLGRQKMQKKIKQLSNHVILVGFGKIGQHIASELELEKTAFVVIDKHPNAEQACLQAGYLIILGDAEEDEILEQAGISRASALITAIGNDAANAFVTMSARALSNDLFIVAKADEDSSVRKLKKAGADNILNPYAIAGQRLANMVVRPAAIDFLTKTLRNREINSSIQDFVIPENSSLIGKSLASLALRKLTGVTIVTVIRNEQNFPNPPADFCLEANDHVMVLGSNEQQEKFTYLLADSTNEPAKPISES